MYFRASYAFTPILALSQIIKSSIFSPTGSLFLHEFLRALGFSHRQDACSTGGLAFRHSSRAF